MPVVTTTLIVLGLITLFGVALVVFWNYVVGVFQNTVRPKLLKHFGAGVTNTVIGLIEWLDGRVVLARTMVRAVWREFKKRVLGVTSVYKKKTATTATVQSEVTLGTAGANGRETVTAEEREVSLADLPPEVRAALLRDPAAAVSVDVGAEFDRRVVAKATAEGATAAELDLSV